MDARSRPHRPCRIAALLLVVAAGTPAGAPGDAADFAQGRVLVDKAWRGDLAAVHALLNAGVDANYSDQSGGAALTAAASTGHLEVVRALLAAGAKVNARSPSGWTALLHATHAGHVEVVRALLAMKADPDITAPNFGGGRTALMAALSVGNMAMAQLLLEGGANVNARTSYGATPLRFAMWNDDARQRALVEKLLAAGADVNAGNAPRFMFGDDPRALLRSTGGTALGDAAGSGSADMVRVLLAAGAKVDARQPGLKTPLMLASSQGNVSVVHVLLRAGADPNARDAAGQTALDLALANGRQEVAMILQRAAVSVARR